MVLWWHRAPAMANAFPAKGEGSAAYTAVTTIAYEGDGSDNQCIYWEQNYAFMPGTYQAKIYHKGELIGENTFDFK